MFQKIKKTAKKSKEIGGKMIVVLKKKTLFLIAVILIAVLIGGVTCGVCVKAAKAANIGKKVVVIDAGHGGSDRGVIGKNGTEEAAKNLEIAKLLRSLLSDAGFVVVMTRSTNEGADKPTGGFKQEDFSNRKKIIEDANPDFVVSIHCNKFPQSDRRGVQVFYNKLSDEGKQFATALQTSLNGLNAKHVGRTFTALPGEYFMLNCTFAPSAIVECGFLSNEEDERLLNDDDYLEDLTYSIYAAIAEV